MQQPIVNGKVLPPSDMMEAARRSLTPTGFANLMGRTEGRIPTPAELVEFADAERAAGITHAHEVVGEVVGAVEAAVGQVAAMFEGKTAMGGMVDPGKTYLVGEPTSELFVPREKFAPLTSSD